MSSRMRTPPAARQTRRPLTPVAWASARAASAKGMPRTSPTAAAAAACHALCRPGRGRRTAAVSRAVARVKATPVAVATTSARRTSALAACP